MRSNFKNTIQFANRFLGLTTDCQEQIKEEEKFLPFKVEPLEDKRVAFKVRYRGENVQLLPEQIMATYLNKLKGFFAPNPGDKPDVVISVPSYYTPQERQAMLDSVSISDMKCVKLMNENTAIALSYGFFRKAEFTDKPRNVAFVDFGHGKLTATIVQYTKGKLKILSHVSDRNLGARNIDELLVDLLGGEFAKKYGADPRKPPKCRLRMLEAIEKFRKILSANNEATVSVECLLEDEDLHKTMKRADFEALIEPVMIRVEGVCLEALKESGLKGSDVYSVEMIGEATRIPKVKEICQKVFEVEEVSRTQNSSEVVARGCSLMAAMISPYFNVSDFQIEENNHVPITVSWSIEDGKQKDMVLFPRKCNYPTRKSLTFDNRQDKMHFGIGVTPSELPLGGLYSLLGRYSIEPPKAKHDKFSLLLMVNYDLHGICKLESAELVEEYMEEKKIPIKRDKPKKEEAAKKEGDKPAEGAPADEKAPEAAEEKKDDVVEPEIEYELKEVKKTDRRNVEFK